MTQARLYSIAALAKLLDQPESTLHYWKNRFDAFLPSLGEGRHKRFRPEAVDIFKTIGELLRQGLSAQDVRGELARLYPMNVPAGEAQAPGAADASVPISVQGPVWSSPEMTAQIGREIARAIGEELRGMLSGTAALPAGDGDAARALAEELALVKAQNADLTAKLKVLEAELTRLRKDGREMEKYLLAKINAAKGQKASA